MAEKKLENELAKDWDVSMIRYSRVIEDHRVLSKGLQVKRDEDIILSIARYIAEYIIPNQHSRLQLEYIEFYQCSVVIIIVLFFLIAH